MMIITFVYKYLFFLLVSPIIILLMCKLQQRGVGT
jgi:hypothetical protein